MIRAIAIDDEPIALEVIRQYASDTPLLNLLQTFTDPFQALAFLKTHQVDLLFLDIQMPDIGGIQLYSGLKEKPAVIFTTAHSQYAVKGFDLEAIDYLVKPIKFEVFLNAVDRVRKRLQPIPAEPVADDFFFVKSGYQSVKIHFNDIVYIEGLDDYVKFHLSTPGTPLLLSLMSMKSVLDKLPSERFIRVHRSFIVPSRRITGIRGREVHLGELRIPMGETYQKTIRDWIAGNR